MRKIKVNDKVFTVRSITRKMLLDEKLNLPAHGYSFDRYSPIEKTVVKENGEKSIEIDEDKSVEARYVLLNALLGSQVVDEIDEAGGVAGQRKVWLGIIRETYGSEEEEVNLKKSGDGEATQKG